MAPSMTIAVVKLANGFVVLGKSAPADPANFNAKLGERFAMEDAERQIWQLEGYLLRDRLSRGEVPHEDDAGQAEEQQGSPV
jgi:hypothetical protein